MQRKSTTGIAAVLLLLLMSVLHPAILAQAAAGTVYSCTINRCYAHPVTGEIEDSGGQASYATGQGMAEGAVGSVGIMEVTEDGAYYLTFRIGLIDYISGQTFFVQNVGDTEWTAVTPTVTANGSDSNGATSDLCIPAPSENCIVKGSMYVTQMGRNVIFYFYPNNYTEGNTTDMTAAVVTESAENQGDGAPPDSDETASQATEETTDPPAPVSEEPSFTDGPEQTKPETDQAADAALSSAQGLSLSTAEETVAEPESREKGSGIGVLDLIAAVTVSLTISGLILMAAAAGIVYYFRKNWRRWGGYDEEEDDDEEA